MLSGDEKADEMSDSAARMKTERTPAGEQAVIEDAAVKRKVPGKAKPGGGDLEGLPLGERPSRQVELFEAEDGH